ncbi:MAG: hypothetical protein HC780_06215 [Leptolyngbyaceae cyanobacterium CSU_1_3]|nr:hypothetical protein [Leptolyngbyaceae cyanobacterium CSU_1_3]
MSDRTLLIVLVRKLVAKIVSETLLWVSFLTRLYRTILRQPIDFGLEGVWGLRPSQGFYPCTPSKIFNFMP